MCLSSRGAAQGIFHILEFIKTASDVLTQNSKIVILTRVEAFLKQATVQFKPFFTSIRVQYKHITHNTAAFGLVTGVSSLLSV